MLEEGEIQDTKHQNKKDEDETEKKVRTMESQKIISRQETINNEDTDKKIGSLELTVEDQNLEEKVVLVTSLAMSVINRVNTYPQLQ